MARHSAKVLPRQFRRGLFLLIMCLNVLGLAGGSMPVGAVNSVARVPASQTEEEETRSEGKAKTESITVEHRRRPRHEALYRAAPGGPAESVTDAGRPRTPTHHPAIILCESDRMNGLGAPLLC